MKINYCKVLFVVALLIIAIWLFYQPKIKVDFDKLENTTTIRISEKTINQPIWKSAIRRIFSAPFDLEFYKIVIVNAAQIRESSCSVDWNVTIGDDAQIISDKGYFDMIKIEEELFWSKNAILNIDYKKVSRGQDNCEFLLAFEAYAEPYFVEIVAKIFLFMVSAIGLWFFLVSVWGWLSSK